MIVETIEIRAITSDADAALDKTTGKVEDLNKETEKTGDVAKKSGDKYSGSIKKSSTLVRELDKLTGGLASKFLDVTQSVKKSTVALRAMTSATIIGALIVAVTTVALFWEDISDFITGANSDLDNQIDKQQQLGDDVQHQLDLLNASENTLKLQGKSQKQINDLKKIEIEKLIDIQTLELEQQKNRLQNLIDVQKGGGDGLESFFRIAQGLLVNFAKIIEDTLGKFGIDFDLGKRTAKITENVLEKIFGSEEDIREQEERIESLEKSLVSLANTRDGILLKEREGAKQDIVESVGGGGLTPEGIIEISNLNALNDAKLAATEDVQEAMTEAERLEAERRKRLAELEAESKIASLFLFARALRNIGSILGKSTAEAKTAAIAGATINAYLGISEVWSTKADAPFLGASILEKIAATAVVGSLAFANVQKIRDVNVPGSGRSSRGTFALGSGSVATQTAPSFNLVRGTTENQIIEGLQGGDRPIRAFVLSGEMTNQQSFDRNIEETNSI